MSNFAQPLRKLTRGTDPAAGNTLTLTDAVWVPKAARHPGQELSYVEKTSDTTINTTSDATAVTIVTADTVEFDGKPVLIEFFSVEAQPPDADAGALVFNLYQDGADIGRVWVTRTVAAENGGGGVFATRRMSPTAGPHTYSIRCWRSAGIPNGLVLGGVGGAGVNMPAYIRITRAAGGND